MMAADPKPQTIKLKRRDYDKLRAAAYAELLGLCACGCGRTAESLHHLAGGIDREDVLENVVCLAGDGTRLCHGAVTSGQTVFDYSTPRELGATTIRPMAVRAGIRATLEERFPEKLDYLRRRKGAEWLDLNYPG